jgi:hypothetical protein
VVAQQSVAGAPAQDQLRRQLLQQTLKFYEGVESSSSSPEERARVRDRAQRVRTKLEATRDQSDR